MPIVLALLLMLLAGLGWPQGPAYGQASEAGTFLDPFPANDRYRVQVWGDDMAQGLMDGLADQLSNDPRLDLDKKYRSLHGLLRVDIDQEVKSIDQVLGANTPHIGVVLLGIGDRLSLRRANGRRIAVGSDEWKAEYSRRLDAVMRAFRKRSVAVFWVGLPIVRRRDITEDVETINELIRNRALANGVRYIDIFAGFADADGNYSSQGPDLNGKMRTLRDQDGIYFTGSGYRKLAYFVERELRKAAAQAWDERAIPLAGSEAEQARVRPFSAVKLAPMPISAAAPGAKGAVPRRQPVAGAGTPGGDGGLKAETSQVTIRSLGDQGREQSVTVEILRPAIPASVVSLLTRRESQDKPTRVGDMVMTEILGGLTVVSSVTPVGETGEKQRSGSDLTSPLYRVLQRGESMPPKPGRADEMPWPRPEAVLDPRLSAPLQAGPAAMTLDTGSVSPAAQAKPELAAPLDGPPLPRRPSRSFFSERRR